jgi:hypothetical protein
MKERVVMTSSAELVSRFFANVPTSFPVQQAPPAVSTDQILASVLAISSAMSASSTPSASRSSSASTNSLFNIASSIPIDSIFPNIWEAPSESPLDQLLARVTQLTETLETLETRLAQKDREIAELRERLNLPPAATPPASSPTPPTATPPAATPPTTPPPAATPAPVPPPPPPAAAPPPAGPTPAEIEAQRVAIATQNRKDLITSLSHGVTGHHQRYDQAFFGPRHNNAVYSDWTNHGIRQGLFPNAEMQALWDQLNTFVDFEAYRQAKLADGHLGGANDTTGYGQTPQGAFMNWVIHIPAEQKAAWLLPFMRKV